MSMRKCIFIFLINILLLVLLFNIGITKNMSNFDKIFDDIINRDRGIDTISSSFLIEKGKPKDFYGPLKAFDKKNDTAWVAGGSNNGINEYIIFKIETGIIDDKFPKDIEIIIINGLAKNKKLFNANNRVKVANLEIYECEISIGQDKFHLLQKPILNSVVKLNFSDIIKPQSFKISIYNKQKSSRKFTSFMYVGKLIIKEVYTGSKYRDTCISEIYFKNKLPF